MDFLIIDAHAHLWLHQNGLVDGLEVHSLGGGQSSFMGEVRQMLPPYMVDGKNSAELFLANMNYARVSSAVITQEYIDGIQNEYLLDVQKTYHHRFLCCGLVDVRHEGYLSKGKKLIEQGFKAIKIPAQRLITNDKRVFLTEYEMMLLFKEMEQNNIILSIDLAQGAIQVQEMQEIIREFPALKIAIGHFGMVNRPGWKSQIKLARNENVMIESGGITWLFNDDFYPYKGAIKAIKEAASLVGMDKLMWGSDYPRTMVAITYQMSYDFVVKSKWLNHEEKKAFLGVNAQRFYGFEKVMTLPYVKNMLE